MRHTLKKVIWITNLEMVYLRIRFWFYWYFKRQYVLDGIKNIKGECHKNCSIICCGYWGCKHYNCKTGKCMNYNNRPICCIYAPFDEKQKPERIKKVCRLSW